MKKQEFLKKAIEGKRELETCIYNSIFREYQNTYFSEPRNILEEMNDFKSQLFEAVYLYNNENPLKPVSLTPDKKGEYITLIVKY